MKKYLWLLIFLTASAIIFFYCYSISKTPGGAKTTEAVAKLDRLVISQDKAVERIYSGAKKEARRKNEEIKSAVKTLSPDAVARSLDALLGEYRRERDGGS